MKPQEVSDRENSKLALQKRSYADFIEHYSDEFPIPSINIEPVRLDKKPESQAKKPESQAKYYWYDNREPTKRRHLDNN